MLTLLQPTPPLPPDDTVTPAINPAVADLVARHAWVAITALVIMAAVRLLKSDTKIPIDIPPRWRVWLALGLGVVAGILDAVARGTAWPDALLGGLTSSVLAIVAQDTIVGS